MFFYFFFCIDFDCVKQFKKQDWFLDYLVKGDYLYDLDKIDSIEDIIKCLWVEKCVFVRGNQYVILFEIELIDFLFLFIEFVGYVLKKWKKGI